MKFTFYVLILTLFASISFAQTAPNEYKKNEFYVGFSTVGSDGDFNNGGEVSFVRNFSRYIGIKGDFSAHAGDRRDTVNVSFGGTITPLTAKTSNRTLQFLGGIQVKDNAAKTRFKPFGHALFGVAARRTDGFLENCPTASVCNVLIAPRERNTTFSGAFGGGLDVRLNDRIDVRAVQIDYNPIRFNGSFDNKLRLGIGIVFH